MTVQGESLRDGLGQNVLSYGNLREAPRLQYENDSITYRTYVTKYFLDSLVPLL